MALGVHSGQQLGRASYEFYVWVGSAQSRSAPLPKEVLEDLVEKATHNPLDAVRMLRTEAYQWYVSEIRERPLVEILDAVGNDYWPITLLRNQNLAAAPLT